MKKTTFAIQNIKTEELLTLNVETDYYEDCGIHVTTEYSIDNYGDLGVWETSDLWAALLVKEFNSYGDWATKETPSRNCSNEDVIIVAIHRLNDTVKVITSENVPQSIFELIDGMDELLKLHSYDSDFVFCEFTYNSKKTSYEKYPKETKINGYVMSHVCSVLEHQGRLPEIYAEDHLFITAMNNLLKRM